MSTSETDICNQALERVGDERIAAIDDTSVTSARCNFNYPIARRQLLRKYPWSCAAKRATLAQSSETDVFEGRDERAIYQLPGDYLRMISVNEQYDIYSRNKIEGRKIYSNEQAPLRIRYVHDLEDTNILEEAFKEALAMFLALKMCEPATQSNTKHDKILVDYRAAIAEAKKINAIEREPQDIPDGSWVEVRR